MRKKEMFLLLKILFHWIPLIWVVILLPTLINNYKVITWLYVGLVFILYGLNLSKDEIEKYLGEDDS